MGKYIQTSQFLINWQNQEEKKIIGPELTYCVSHLFHMDEIFIKTNSVWNQYGKFQGWV